MNDNNIIASEDTEATEVNKLALLIFPSKCTYVSREKNKQSLFRRKHTKEKEREDH